MNRGSRAASLSPGQERALARDWLARLREHAGRPRPLTLTCSPTCSQPRVRPPRRAQAPSPRLRPRSRARPAPAPRQGRRRMIGLGIAKWLPDRPGQCVRGRRHPRHRAGSVGVGPDPGGPRPTPPASGYSADRSRKATDRRPRADAARDRTRNTPGRGADWYGLRSPASRRWRWAQPSPSRNARNGRAPSALDSACSRPAPLPQLGRLWRHSIPPARDGEPALRVNEPRVAGPHPGSPQHLLQHSNATDTTVCWPEVRS